MLQTLEGREALAGALQALLQQARRQLWVRSLALESRLYGDPALAQRLQDFLLESPRQELRLLLHSPRLCLQAGATRWVELARRLPSRVSCRGLLLPERLAEREELWIVDGRHWLRRDDPAALTAEWHADDPAGARRQAQAFQTRWDESLPAAELRDLAL